LTYDCPSGWRYRDEGGSYDAADAVRVQSDFAGDIGVVTAGAEHSSDNSQP